MLAVVEELEAVLDLIPGLAQGGGQLVFVGPHEDITVEGGTYLVAVLTIGLLRLGRGQRIGQMTTQELVGHEDVVRLMAFSRALHVLTLQAALCVLGGVAGEEKPIYLTVRQILTVRRLDGFDG